MDCHPAVARQLDFDSILTILSKFCFSSEGAEFITHRAFLSNEAEILRELSLVQSVLALPTGVLASSDQFPPVADTVKALSNPKLDVALIGLYRIARYLVAVRAFCVRVAEARSSGQNADGIQALCAKIPVTDRLSEHILEVVDEEGGLIIANIEALDALHQRRMDAARSIEGELKRIHHRNSHYYQSPTPVMRNNRFCLSLNADFLGKIPSVVIDQSASGHTLFIEPLPCVEMNNRWVRYTQKFQNECRAFIWQLISKVRGHCAALESVMRRFSFVDSVCARARFARKYDCHPGVFTSKGIALHHARHPLLGDAAVPITIVQDADCYGTVISGPNGGGKTVTLKSIGLMVLMHYFAMPVPAAAGSLIPRCDNLLLLIGDQQSILSHQSSFTAQMKQVAAMIRAMNARSLVLFDELGGNTDPEEGAALASAIISRCTEEKARTFATTHFTQLKEYAVKNASMELISMEYDHQKHKPRFVVVSGLSEGSHALSVAREAGVDSAVVHEATRMLKGEALAYKKLFAELTQQQQQYYNRQEELVRLEARLTQRDRDLRERGNEIRTKYIGDIERLISSSRKRLEGMIAQLREKNITLPTKEIHSQMSVTNKQLSEGAAQLRAELSPLPNNRPPAHFSVGDAVQIDGKPQILTVTKVIDTGTVEVSSNSLRIAVLNSRVTPVARPQDGTAGVRIVTPRRSFSPVLDVRGKYVDEIEPLILRCMDDALYNNRSEFAIIHGVGSGALQREVTGILERHEPAVQWRYAAPEDGGRGKTIVTLTEADEK